MADPSSAYLVIPSKDFLTALCNSLELMSVLSRLTISTTCIPESSSWMGKTTIYLKLESGLACIIFTFESLVLILKYLKALLPIWWEVASTEANLTS